MSLPILPISPAALPEAVRAIGQAKSSGFQDVFASAVQTVEARGQAASATDADRQSRAPRSVNVGSTAASGDTLCHAYMPAQAVARGPVSRRTRLGCHVPTAVGSCRVTTSLSC